MRKYNYTNIDSSYKVIPFAEAVEKALSTPLRRFPMLKNYILVFDEENKEVVILFPLNDINRMGRQLKEIVLTDLSNNFKKSGLTLMEKKGVLTDIYRVGFIPIIFGITNS